MIKKLSISVFCSLVFILLIFTFYSTFSLEDSYIIESDIYNINDGYITSISSNTSISLFYKYFNLDNCYIKVVDSNNQEITSSYVYSGSKTILYDDNDREINSYTNIILGDVYADGLIDDNDFSSFGKMLVYDDEINDYYKHVMDIDSNDYVNIADLVYMDKILSDGYESMSLNYSEYTLLSGEELQLIGSVSPSIILNQNLKWQSSDSNIATVDDSGKVSAISEGEVIISASSFDNSVSDTFKLIVDNNVKLTSDSGNVYVNGDELIVGIRSVDYDNLSCSTSNTKVKCRIDGKSLIIDGNGHGESVVTVSNGEYGTVDYSVYTFLTNINVFPMYGCMTKNSSNVNGKSPIVSPQHAGEISFDVDRKDIIVDAYGDGTVLRVKSGDKTGRAVVTIKGSTTKDTATFTVDVYEFGVSVYGTAMKVATEKEIPLIVEGSSYGECSNTGYEDVVSCSIYEDKLYLVGLRPGVAYLTLKNFISYNGRDYNCGQASFTVVVEG